jgi:hypothetical protein
MEMDEKLNEVLRSTINMDIIRSQEKEINDD